MSDTEFNKALDLLRRPSSLAVPVVVVFVTDSVGKARLSGELAGPWAASDMWRQERNGRLE